jgi:hypothetical protein
MTATYHAQRSNPCWVSNAHELGAVDMKSLAEGLIFITVLA